MLDNHTYFYHIMTRVNNGDKIVLKKLDDYVVSNKTDINCSNFQLQIDFSRLESKASTSDVIKDIISIKELDSTKVLLHPVIKSYIDIRWRKMRHFINFNFLLYILFLLSYSLFIGYIFYRGLHYDNTPHEVSHELKNILPALTDHGTQGSMIAARINIEKELARIESFVDAFVLDEYTIAVFEHFESDLPRYIHIIEKQHLYK